MTWSYIKKILDSIEKLWDPINEFDKVSGYKINMQTFAAFLYTNNELFEKEIKKIPFTVAWKE